MDSLPRAPHHDQKRESDRDEVVLEPFPLLASHPIHEETVVNVDSHNRAEHLHDDGEGGHARKQPEQQA